MAKVVIFTKEIVRGFLIKNFMAGGKSIENVEVWEGDIVNDFSYLGISEVESINGRIDKVAFTANKTQKANQPFSKNISVGSVTIDGSENYQSDIRTIPASSILEYGASGPVDDLLVEPLVKLKLGLTMSDKTKQNIVVKEGDVFFGMHVYPPKSNPVHADLQVEKFIYKIVANKFDITGFTLTNGSTKWDVTIDMVKSFGISGLVFSEDTDITDLIAQMESDDKIGGIVLPNGAFVDKAFTLSNGKIVGPGIVKDNVIDGDEAVITEAITCAPGAEVTIRGLVISDKCFNTLSDPASVTFEGCKFIGLAGEATKLYAVRGQGLETSSNATELIFRNCYFGDNASNMYNFFELDTKIGHAVFENNYFTREATNHNIINIYEVADDATIDIVGNHFEYSANAIRIGPIGNPQNVTINIIDNVYDATDEANPDWAGLFFVQPYATRTQSMAGVTINCRGNVGPADTQLYYIYCGSDDTQLDDTTKPVINEF